MSEQQAGAGGTSFTATIALWASRHRRLVVLGWLVAVIAALVSCSVLTVDDSVEGNAPGESGRAFTLVEERFGTEEGRPDEIIVFSHPTLTVDDAAYEALVAGLLRDFRALRVEDTRSAAGSDVLDSKRLVASTISHYDIGL